MNNQYALSAFYHPPSAYLNNSEALDILKKAGYEDFEKAKESVIQLLAEDIDMRLILEIYKEEPQQIAV